MRTVFGTVIGLLLCSATTNPDRARPPVVAAEAVEITEVGPGSDSLELGISAEAFFVRRPVGAYSGTKASVFVVSRDGVELRRVPVEYGRSFSSFIQIVSGVASGDRVVVSDMRA